VPQITNAALDENVPKIAVDRGKVDTNPMLLEPLLFLQSLFRRQFAVGGSKSPRLPKTFKCQLLDGANDKQRIGHKVAFPQAPGFRTQTVQPLHPVALHP
jgi:hypothetical protein